MLHKSEKQNWSMSARVSCFIGLQRRKKLLQEIMKRVLSS